MPASASAQSPFSSAPAAPEMPQCFLLLPRLSFARSTTTARLQQLQPLLLILLMLKMKLPNMEMKGLLVAICEHLWGLMRVEATLQVEATPTASLTAALMQ